jgi:HSP20 family protein
VARRHIRLFANNNSIVPFCYAALNGRVLALPHFLTCALKVWALQSAAAPRRTGAAKRWRQEMIEIDETIGHLEHLYRALTGNQVHGGESPYAPIPAEQDPVAHVNEEMERLLRTLNSQVMPGHHHHRQHPATRGWAPPISLWEADNEVTILVDVPGTARDHVDVKVQAGLLVITGNRPSPSNGHRVAVAERPFGAFQRFVRLPPGLRTSDMTAQLKDGVLEIRIPRDAGAPGTTRSVPVA